MQKWTARLSRTNLMSFGLSRVFSKTDSVGLAAGTLVATARGWQGVETLAVGDQVWTFDDGLQTLMGKKRRQLQPVADRRTDDKSLVRIPAYALGNERDIICDAHCGILLECQNAVDPMGEPYAVVPASALVGICGVTTYDLRITISVYALQFSQEQAVYCDSGLPFHCPGLQATKQSRYDVKTHTKAKALMTEADIDALAVREPYEDFFTELAADRA